MMEFKEQLKATYKRPAPSESVANYDANLRIGKFRAVLPHRKYRRALHMGCGNGFLTREIPADLVLGVDLSGKAVADVTDGVRSPNVRFEAAALFDLSSVRFGKFDLIVITDVLHPESAGGGYHVVEQILRDLAEPGGIVVSCHIEERKRRALPFSLLRKTLYAYHDTTRVLEVFAAI